MPAKANLFQVVTFAADPLHGNPAFVLSGAGEASDKVLIQACTMLRADVIAVVGDASGGDVPLKFLTREGSHPGPGHSTMAAAHTVLRGNGAARAVTFHLPNGDKRLAQVEGEHILVDFPVMPGAKVDRVAEMEAALGARPRETWVAPFGYVAIYDDASVIARLQPDLIKVAAFDRSAVIATAPGGPAASIAATPGNSGADIVIRVFAPNVGLPEDPVCGTAHRIIVPYWSQRLGRKKIHSRQLSPRGGDLWCEDKGQTIVIGGESNLVIDGHIRLPE
jgi:predicted PhzF superfamily epimerase YddE/YHI9